MELDDQELIKLVLQGNHNAFEKIVAKYERPIYSYICKMGCNPEDAKGITQGVFLKAFNALPSFQNKSKFSTWLFAIAGNKAKNWLRKSKKLAIPVEIEKSDNKNTTPEELYLKKEYINAVRKAYSSLPERYRSVLHLYYHHNLSYAEIAKLLDIGPRTVETRLYRGRRMVKKYLLLEEGELFNK